MDDDGAGLGEMDNLWLRNEEASFLEGDCLLL
jgi:hypothetical protein